MAYTEFYCQNGGSNLNAGSTNNNTATYTSIHGNWTNATGVFTPTDGSTPASTVSVGMWAAVYVDGATVAASISRISNVAAGVNGAITANTTVVGSKPANQTGTATIKVGGAWQGPNAASGFPFTLVGFGNNQDATPNIVRVNLKNDQTYSLTSSYTPNNSGSRYIVQGYNGSTGDGGKATIDGGTSTGTTLAATGPLMTRYEDLIFTTSITSGTNDLVAEGTQNGSWVRCVFSGSRGHGLNCNATAGDSFIIECEAYNNNRSNTSGKAGFSSSAGHTFIRCISHDNTGSNTVGFQLTSSVRLNNCISDTNGSHGIYVNSSAGNAGIVIENCDVYNNGGDGLNLDASAGVVLWMENTNLIKNTGAGINNASTLFATSGYVYNCGYGAGTQANGSSDTLGRLVKSGTVTYPSNSSPYVDGPNGDFRLSLGTALCAGRSSFTETATSYSGTIGYPDIGSAQAIATPAGSINASTSTLRDGFVDQTYYVLAEYTSDFTISVTSGALPGGLSLSQPTSSSWLISGTPTTVESASAVLTVVNSAGGSGTFTMNIQVYANPDEGIGGMIGG